jgi:predicted dienelactone hydrolase
MSVVCARPRTLERRERRRVPRDDGPRVASLDEARLEGYWGMGFAWQLRPALAALACVLIAAYLQFRGAAGWLAILLYVVASLCAASTALVVYLMPPTVDLGVQTASQRFEHVGFRDTELELSAETQQLIVEEAVDRPARFSCRIYYPAAATSRGGQKEAVGLLTAEGGGAAAAGRRRPAKYATPADSYALSQVAGVPLPPFVYSHLCSMSIRATEQAAAHSDANNLPVIVLSHGLTALPICYWSIVGALVRAGYVVVMPTHNDGSAAHVALQDGTTLPYETEVTVCSRAGHDMASKEYKDSHESEIESTMKAYRCGQLRRRAAELSCSLDYVLSDEAAAAGGGWSVDPHRVAFVGHSFGGATALLASELDHRAACCVCYDPWVEPQHPVHQKYQQAGMRRCAGLHLICSDWEGGVVDRNLSAMLSEHRLHSNSRRRVLPDTAHQSYTDFALLAPIVLRKLGMLGAAESRPMIRTIVEETLSFIAEAMEPPAQL